MDTLYDLLGALPRDDAEGLRSAFRQAVKGAHPDLNPGDPDAGQKFRQIVRAQEILLDREQRAAYDHLLELARVEAVEEARAGRIHRLASWVMALAGASAVSIGGLAVVALLWTSTEPAADTNPTADDPVAPVRVAALPEPPLPSPSPLPLPAPATPAEAADSMLPPLGPPLDITPAPGVAELDRLHGFSHAYNDISHAKRLEKARHAANARRKSPPPAESVPTPEPRWTAANDLSRLEAAPFDPRP
jgi:curved DNA-binding protein CbpA